ncbi:MAG TPA: class I SAM-dependent methyltransferase [Nitrospiraceae bacterium]|nr:class I SAM-dependent methyltransferase [Nitrospiraceae bacterium]
MEPEPVVKAGRSSLDQHTDRSSAYPPEAFEFLESWEERHFWFLERNRIIGDWMVRHIPDLRRKAILEVGCGNGTVLAHLRRMGLQVMGVDVFQTALIRCRRRTGAPVSQADASHLPFREHVKVVGLFDCLEHFDRPEQVIQEVYRCLQPGGFLLVTVPAVPSLYGWIDRLSGHRLRYDRRGLVALLQNGGFELRRISYFMTAVFPALILSRLFSEWRFRNTPDAYKPLAEQFQISPGSNALLGTLCALDRAAMRIMNLPIGGSLIALAHKI